MPIEKVNIGPICMGHLWIRYLVISLVLRLCFSCSSLSPFSIHCFPQVLEFLSCSQSLLITWANEHTLHCPLPLQTSHCSFSRKHFHNPAMRSNAPIECFHSARYPSAVHFISAIHCKWCPYFLLPFLD